MNSDWKPCLWFGLPFKFREYPEPEIEGGFFLNWLVPLFAWVDGSASGGEGFSFLLYEGSYWKALYNYLFHPEKFQ